MRRTRWVALLAVSSLALAACSGHGSPTSASSVSTATTAASASSATSAATSASSSTGTPSATRTTAATSASTSTSTQGAQSCLQLAKSLPLAEQVGQLYMMGVTGQSLGPQETARLSGLHIGSVVLLGTPPSGVAGVRALTDRIQALGQLPGIPVLVSADQEGGQIQRLTGAGFTTIPAATVQDTWSASGLQQSWAVYGQQMAQAGVRYDLAPVTDLVSPQNVSRNAPIGQLHRNYGTTPADVERGAGAVVQGLAQAGVVTAAKHFPGLGAVTVNTDYGAATDTTTGPDAASIGVFGEVIDSGVSSVMVGSAIYSQIDPKRPAMFSPTIVTGILRNRLGFQRVIISDDLGQAGAVANWTASGRGTTFLLAGGDIALDGDVTSIATMVADTESQARTNAAFAADISNKVARVLAMKAQAGLVSCHV